MCTFVIFEGLQLVFDDVVSYLVDKIDIETKDTIKKEKKKIKVN